MNNKIASIKQDINSLNEKRKINSKHIEAYTSLLEYLNENKINNFYEIPNDNIHKISCYNIVEFPSIINSKSLRQLIINYSLITNTSGTKAIIKRMRNAINDVRHGFYKNPLFYYGIKKPDEVLKINNKNPIDDEIVQRYCLNSNQQKVLHKAINTNSVLYLQGPPGTGKTQTISAIVDWINKQGMNVVMTSSTHEAINNFFDRVSDNNKNNPNLVALKYSFMKKENNTNNSEEKFSETNIFKLFKQRMMNFVLGDNEQDNNRDEFKQQFNEYKKKYQLSIPSGYDSYLARPLVDFIFKNIKANNQFLNNFKMIDDQERFLGPICYEEQHTLGIDKDLENKEKKYNSNQHNDFIELLSSFLKSFDITDISKIKFNQNNYLDEIDKMVNLPVNNSNKTSRLDKLKDKLSIIRDKNIDVIENYEKLFLDYIIDNQLINIIGVTTTSRNQINVNNREINLYSDYPIDYMIIDEISKSSTPEIFSKAILAKKVIFAGDYLQLPPQSNIYSEELLDKLVKYKKDNDDDESDNVKDENKQFDDDNQDQEKRRKLEESINELYKTSFFKILIEKINQKSNSPSLDQLPYQFLTISHRFGKKIMDIVNILYPSGEKLETPHDYNLNNEKKFDLKIKNKNLNSEVVLVNLTRATDDFKRDHIDFNLSFSNNHSFDQLGTLFKYKGNTMDVQVSSLYNQFSAYKILEIIKTLFNDNQKHFKDNKKSRIGIICLTSAQKNVVKKYIEEMSKENQLLQQFKRQIKVDTIDNFQGREEDIIIVDFIRGKNKVENGKIIPSKKRNISFLSEKERINVAVSRAKKKLILVGQFEYLSSITEVDLFTQYLTQLQDDDASYIEY